MTAGAFLLTLAWSAGCALTSVNSVSLRGPDIHVRDIVAPDCLAGGHRGWGNLVIASLPEGVQLQLTRAALANLARRRIPALAHLSVSDPDGRIAFRSSGSPVTRSERSCFSASRAIGAGEELSGEDLTATACADLAPAALRYDRATGVVRTGAPLVKGDYLGPLSVPSTRYPHSGDAMVIATTIGAVSVERPVTAVQSVAHGRAIFVRDADGNIFSAPLANNTAASP